MWCKYLASLCFAALISLAGYVERSHSTVVGTLSQNEIQIEFFRSESTDTADSWDLGHVFMNCGNFTAVSRRNTNGGMIYLGIMDLLTCTSNILVNSGETEFILAETSFAVRIVKSKKSKLLTLWHDSFSVQIGAEAFQEALLGGANRFLSSHPLPQSAALFADLNFALASLR